MNIAVRVLGLDRMIETLTAQAVARSNAALENAPLLDPLFYAPAGGAASLDPPSAIETMPRPIPPRRPRP